MIKRRSLIKAPLAIPILGLSYSNFATSVESEIFNEVDIVNISAKLEYKDPTYINRILKSSRYALNIKYTYERDKLPLFFNIKLTDKFLNQPAGDEYTLILISEDFYSPLRESSDICVTQSSNVFFRTTVPHFKHELGSDIARSNFYLILLNGESVFISRLNILSDFILSNTISYPTYKKLLTTGHSLIDKIAGKTGGYDNDILITPVVINDKSFVNLNITIYS